MKASELKVGERYALGGDRQNVFGQDEVEVVALGVNGSAAQRMWRDSEKAAKDELEELLGGTLLKVADVKGGVLVRYCGRGISGGAVVTAAQLRSTWDEHLEVVERRQAVARAAARRHESESERARELTARIAALTPGLTPNVFTGSLTGTVSMSLATLAALVDAAEAGRGATEVAA